MAPPRFSRVSNDWGAPVTSPVRWGIPDALLAFLGGLIGAIVAATPFSRHDLDVETAAFLAAAFVGQYGATLLVIAWVSHRKGLGRMSDDFGLRIRLNDAWVLGIGLVLSVVLGLFLAPLSHLVGNKEQAVVKQLDSASGAKLAVLSIGAGIVAPFAEELLFRGVLLRALMRRMPVTGAIAVSAFTFGIVHWLLDPHFGTFIAVPALTAVGVVSAIFAVRSGDLSRSMFLHAGFNLLAILQVAVK